MIPIQGQPILTAAAMRAAEQRAVDAGTSLATLMGRAGQGVAEAARRLAAGAAVLVELEGLGGRARWAPGVPLHAALVR